MLTKKQKPILNFVTSFSKKHEYAPSLQEIKRHFKLRSVATVHQHLAALEEKGYLQKRKNQHRSIVTKTTDRLIQIPLRGIIAAGQPIEAIENRETIAVSQSKLPFVRGNYYALRVAGDSMIEENINDGDIVLIKKQDTAQDGEKIVALIDNSEATLKTFYKEKDRIRLQPANKSMRSIILDKETPFAIQGVVVDVVQEAYTSIPVRGTIVEIKQYAKLPLNQIVCGDAVSELKKIPDGSIDLIVTSPPYNLKNSTGNGMKDGRGGKWANAALQKGYTHHNDNMPHNEYVKWQRDCLKEMLRIIPEDGAIFYNHKWRVQGGLLQDRQDIVSGFPVRQVIIWRRKGGLNFNAGYFLPTYEVIYLISKPKFTLASKANGFGDVWEFTQEMRNKHPAAFPVPLIDRIISSTKAKIVLDPFMGSGTTAISALNCKRNYIGIEISPEYCNMAEKRIRQHLE